MLSAHFQFLMYYNHPDQSLISSYVVTQYSVVQFSFLSSLPYLIILKTNTTTE